MINRGLRLPTTATSDGAPGLVKAIGVCFPTSVRIRAPVVQILGRRLRGSRRVAWVLDHGLSRCIGGFDLGARQGGAATAAVLVRVTCMHGSTTFSTVKSPGPYWVRRNKGSATRAIVLSGLALVVCVAGIATAMRTGDTYIPGLLIAPGAAATFGLTLGLEARRKQHQRGE